MLMHCHARSIAVTFLVVFLSAHVAAQGRGPVEKGPGTLAAARKYLEGRWGLLSFEVMPPDKPPITVKGQGTLTYDGFGNLNVEIRVDPETADRLAAVGIPSEKGRLSTSGRTVVDMQARTLTYVLEGAPKFGSPAYGAPSGPLALNKPRHWQVEGDVLTLTTNGTDGKPVSVAKWRKSL
jgi:hypothetical protein